MKFLLTILSVLTLVGHAAAQITYSNLLTYTAINAATNNGSAVIIGAARITMPHYAVQNGGLTATNALVSYVQISLDGTNFMTISTNWPTITNAGIATITVRAQSLNVYSRIVHVTTNNVSVGASVTFGTGVQ
jgi:hypothetical protein